MNLSDWLFWNVDTQNDFVLPTGKLYVQDAEMLKPVWEKLTKLAARNGIRVVNSADFHYPNSSELSSSPNFTTTFPPHCMAGSGGGEFVAETNPKNPLVFDWDKKYGNIPELLSRKSSRNIVVRKDAFDVFAGNPYTEPILKYLAPKKVVVYGVTTNVCVNDAVVGLTARVGQVYVVEDAIKELPNIPLPFENWEELGVKMVQTDELVKIMK